MPAPMASPWQPMCCVHYSFIHSPTGDSIGSFRTFLGSTPHGPSCDAQLEPSRSLRAGPWLLAATGPVRGADIWRSGSDEHAGLAEPPERDHDGRSESGARG